MDCHPHEHVINVRLGIFDLDIKVSVVVENTGIDQFELHRRRTATTCVFLDQPLVRKSSLRQLVEHARVSVTGDGIEIIVQLLNILAVAALCVGQAKQPFLEDRIIAVPQGNREAQQLSVIGEAGNAVLAPPIGATARLVMREIIPCGSAGAIVLAYRPPLSLAEIRAPPTPVFYAFATFFDPALFGVNRSWHVSSPSRLARFDFLGVPGLLRLLEQTPSVQSAGDRPSLCGGAARMMSRLSVENLAECTHCLVRQRVAHRHEHSLRRLCVTSDSIDGEAERSEKPGPDRPLVVTAIALQNAAAVMWMVTGAAGRQRAQTVLRE